MSGSSGTAVTVRIATLGDITELARLEALAFDDPWPARSIAPMLDHPRALVLVAVEPMAVGYVSFSHSGPEAELLRLAVDRRERRRGIGRKLVQTGLERLSADGAERVFLEVRPANEAARELYRRVGFEEISRRARYYRDGSDALVMQRHLA